MGLDLEAIRAEWKRVHGTAPPSAFKRDLLLRGLTHRLCTRALGGLDHDTAALLTELATASDPAAVLARRRIRRIKPGVSCCGNGTGWCGAASSSGKGLAGTVRSVQASPLSPVSDTLARGGRDEARIFAKMSDTKFPEARREQAPLPLCDLHAEVDRGWARAGLQLARCAAGCSTRPPSTVHPIKVLKLPSLLSLTGFLRCSMRAGPTRFLRSAAAGGRSPSGWRRMFAARSPG